jgi:hypothetical protein
VKKYFLFISILLCFCEVFAGSALSQVQSRSWVSPAGAGLYSTLAASYPHTEAEPSNRSASVVNSVRQHTGHGVIGAIEQLQQIDHKAFVKVPVCSSPLFCKQYLSHIYPSHNFW